MTTIATAPTRLTPRSFYRVVAVAETVTWTLLLSGMVLKYGFDIPVAVLIAGSVHGLAFLAYAFIAALVGVNQRWRFRLVVAAVATAVIPYATIPFDRWLERRAMLDGDWRRTTTDDPRDHTRLDRLLRWFLTHPAILVICLVLAVVVVMTVLLLIGPPGSWG